jgi:nicotinamide-nucleotide amidase
MIKLVSTVFGRLKGDLSKSEKRLFLPHILRETAWFYEYLLNRRYFSSRKWPLENLVARYLSETHSTIALAESCTGGLLAHRLTSMAGSSDYFVFSGVTYANQAKIDVLGVLPQTIDKYGAVHENTAAEMARGARLAAKTTYGLSTTGIAGPTGGTEGKPVGTVCIGMATSQNTVGRRFFFPFFDRQRNQSAFAEKALEVLLDELEKNEDKK